MNPLPLPVRIAAGLVATAVEQARDCPRHVVEFPVTAISLALQASMRMQQKVTELAIKGDRALGMLRPVEETPAWATFDEDEPPAPQRRDQHGHRAAPAGPPGPAPTPVSTERPSPPDDRGRRRTSRRDRRCRGAHHAEAAPAPSPTTRDRLNEDASGPNVLPGYREMTIPQLRARLRKLSEDDLRALLAWETDHDNRPPFVTMLTNRITTVTEE